MPATRMNKQECADKRCPLVATLQHAAAPRLCQPVLQALGDRITWQRGWESIRPPGSMSSKRKKAAALTDTRHEESDTIDTDIQSWDDEPARFAHWHNKLPEYLIDFDESFQPLVQHGHTWSKHLMCFTSMNHIHRYRQDLLTIGTFDAPLTVHRNTMATLTSTPVDLSKATDAEKEAEQTELKRFTLGPEQVDKKDKEMARAIVRKMSNPSSRKDWLKRANHSGRALLELLQIERTRLDADLQTRASGRTWLRTSTISSETASPKQPLPASAPSTTN